MQIAHAHHTHGTSAAHHSKTAANAKAKHAAFGAMLSQMQTASHTPTAKTEHAGFGTAHPKPNYAAIMSSVEEKIKAEICKKAAEQQETASQKTEQPKPGANSQAAANSVSEIMALLVRPPMKIVPNFGSARPTYIFVPDVGIVEKEIAQGQVKEPTYREAAAAHLMNDIKAALAEKGITISPNEKFNISVDKYFNVTVTGDDKEKAKAIEDVLNSPADGKNWGLLLQKKSIEDEMLLKDNKYNIFFPSDEYIAKVNKMLVENYLANATNGKVSLDDLYLSADGKIMGLPPELDELINSMEPKYYGKTQQEWEKQISEEYDSYKKQDEEWLKKQEVRHSHIIYDIPKADEALEAYKRGNKEEYVRIIVDGLMETAKSVDLKNTLTKFLGNGVNNTPSTATANIVLENGGLVFG